MWNEKQWNLYISCMKLYDNLRRSGLDFEDFGIILYSENENYEMEVVIRKELSL